MRYLFFFQTVINLLCCLSAGESCCHFHGLPYFSIPQRHRFVARMNDLESIKKSIASGLGISILSARSVKDMERTHQLLTFPLENAAQVRTFYIVYNKNRILKPYVKQFLKFVEHFYK